MTTERGPREIGRLLDGLLGNKGLGRSHLKIEEARRAWLSTAGDEVGGHTRVASLRKGVLTIEVDSAPLCHRLASFKSEALLAGVQEELRRAHVTELRFKLGAFSRGHDD